MKRDFFKALSNINVLKKEFEDLEFIVFRSGETINPKAIEYRLNIWGEKVKKLSRWSKLWNWKTLKTIALKEVSIRSRLIMIEKIEKELDRKE